jgi:hypothetical protein
VAAAGGLRLCSWAACWRVPGGCSRGARWVGGAPGLDGGGGCDFVPGRHAGGSWERVVRGQGGWAAPHDCDFVPGWHAGRPWQRAIRGARWGGGAIQGQGGWTAAGTGKVG